MPPIVSQSTTNLMESSNINIGGSVAARIARHQPSSTSTTSSTSTSHDDGYGEYRNLCELRIRRLERYKKAKSFCSLDSENDSMNYGNLAAAHSSSISTTNIACNNNNPSSPLHSASTSTCSTISSDSSSLSPANSNQQLSINTRPASTSSGNNQSAFESQVELLKQKMISLMENDVSLLQKLVALGETIQELKTNPSNNKPPNATPSNRPSYRPRSLHRTSSDTSISSSYADEEDDDFHPLESGENTFSQSMSAITRLYVDNNNKSIVGDDEDDEIQPNVQYFSRKNSVLRIPIPPRSSNRMIGNSKRALRRPSQLLRQCPPRLLSSEDSGHSSSSDSATPPLQASPKIITDGTSTVSSTLSSSTSSSSTRHPLYDIQECGGGINSKSSRRSNTSVDSGIRDSANSSPTPFVTNVKMMG